MAQYAANSRYARQAINMARRAASYTQTTQRRRVTSGQGVTSQYDRRLIYRKRTMPRRRRRRWRNFKNRVLAVSTKSLGSNTIVRNTLEQSELSLLPGNDTKQAIVQMALYPIRSTSNKLNDINEIMSDSRFENSSKAIFCSAVLDITMRFQSLRTDASSNPSLGAEIDVYEVSWNEASGQSGEAGDLQDCFNIGATDTDVIPGQTNSLVPTDRGWTPFDANAALSQHKLKIWKKTKYFLSAEQTATYQIRDPKTHYFSKDKIPSATSANWQGVTKWIFIVWKPLPGYSYVAAPDNDIARLNIGFTRKYMYKINEDSTDYDCYNS